MSEPVKLVVSMDSFEKAASVKRMFFCTPSVPLEVQIATIAAEAWWDENIKPEEWAELAAEVDCRTDEWLLQHGMYTSKTKIVPGADSAYGKQEKIIVDVTYALRPYIEKQKVQKEAERIAAITKGLCK